MVDIFLWMLFGLWLGCVVCCVCLFITEERRRAIKDEELEKIKSKLETSFEKELFEKGIETIKAINGKVYQDDLELLFKYLKLAVDFVKAQESEDDEVDDK